jgi:hypothetical protein
MFKRNTVGILKRRLPVLYGKRELASMFNKLSTTP